MITAFFGFFFAILFLIALGVCTGFEFRTSLNIRKYKEDDEVKYDDECECEISEPLMETEQEKQQC